MDIENMDILSWYYNNVTFKKQVDDLLNFDSFS